MEELQAQIQLVTQKLNEQQRIINTGSLTRFELTAAQIIKTFNDIQPFSGEDNFKLKTFIKSVETAEQLCGNQNIELKLYCLQIVVNTKITGRARSIILEIPEGQRTWQTVVDTLTLRFRPKQSIHQLLYKAREIKVSHLKDLFYKLNNIKADISEIADFDNNNIFTYENIDKELVLILKSKIVPMLQVQINENQSLFDLESHYCRSEIYFDLNVIKENFKLSKQSLLKGKFDSKQKNRENKTNKFVSNNQNFSNSIPSREHFFNRSNKYKVNNPGPSKNSEPMEIDNVEMEKQSIIDNGEELEALNEEINFH